MKALKWSVMLAATALLLIAGCAEDENPYPGEPASATGTSGSSGEAELDFGSHLITVTVVDASSQGISGITIVGHLLKDYLCVIAIGNGSYYSNYKLVPYSEMTSGGDLPYAKPSAPQTIEDDVEITLTAITRDIYAFTEEPENQEEIPIDTWITPTTYEGDLSDVYALADSISEDRNIIIHITDDVAALTNPSSQTITIVMNTATITSDTVFAVLVGLEFHIFDADTLSISYFQYGDSTLPVIFIDDIGMAEGSFFAQFTLTWGDSPHDLDSHLWTPDIEGHSYHIYFGSKGSITTAPYAFLDVDDVTSWGPEHIIIEQAFPGTYYYSVYHYSGDDDIPTSDATVSLLKPDRTVVEFTPPDIDNTGVGWYWHVCTIDGTSGEVTEVGTMNEDPPVTTLTAQRMPSKNH